MQYLCSIAVHITRLSMSYAFKFRLMITMVYCSLLFLRWGRGVVVAVALSSPVAPGLSLSQPTVTAGSAPWRFPGFCVCVYSVLYVYIYLISRWLALITNKSLFLVSTLNKDFLSYLILFLPISHPLRQDMGSLLWKQTLIYVCLSLYIAVWNIMSYWTYCVIMASTCIKSYRKTGLAFSQNHHLPDSKNF